MPLERSADLQAAVTPDQTVRPGDRVRLEPRPGGDIMDIALRGRVAVVESLEQDLEGLVHVAVVIEDDPGKDLGYLRQIAHRFFFRLDEVQPLTRQ